MVLNVKPSNEDPKPATAVLILAPAGLLAGVLRRLAYSPIYSHPPVSSLNKLLFNRGDSNPPAGFVVVKLPLLPNDRFIMVLAIFGLVELGAPSVKK